MKKIFPRENLWIFLGLALVLILCGQLASAQSSAKPNREISGLVTNERGEPIIGATVIVKGTNKGVVTDLNGRFHIAISAQATLRVTYVGYMLVDVNVADQKTLKVVLKEQNTTLDDVVVVGYGVQKKATLTGSIDNVSSEKINIGVNSNIQNMLTGKLSGVRVLQNSSEPGKFNSEMTVRGMGTPLVVIDGVASEMGVFLRLDPSDVESVSVLKDASAAVYGMRASSGVMLVTTKRGGDEPTLRYEGSYGFSQLINLSKPMGAYDYALLVNDVYRYRLNPEAPKFSADQLETYRTTAGVDVYNEVLRKLNMMTSHTLTASGNVANGAVNYYISGNYMKDFGLYKSGDLNYEKYNIRSNLSAKLKHGFSADVNFSYISDTKTEPANHEGSVWKSIWDYNPINDIDNSVITSLYVDGDKTKFVVPKHRDTNPIASSRSDIAGYHDTNIRFLSGQVGVGWETPAVKGLKLRYLYSFSTFNESNVYLQKGETLYRMDWEGIWREDKYRYPNTIGRAENRHTNSTMQGSVSYATVVGTKHNVDVLALFEQSVSLDPGNLRATRELGLSQLDQLVAGNSENERIDTQYTSKRANQGFVGKIHYDYSGKYLIDVAARYDGSSAFAKNHRWGFFPSLSAGWRLSEEGFIKNTSFLSFVDNLKIRGSYGVVGDDGSSSYQWVSGYRYPSDGYVFNDAYTNGLNTRGLPYEKLTWYTAKLSNVGIDWSFWNGKLGGSTEVYKRIREGLLASKQGSLPGTVGVSLPQQNVNSDMVCGWELSLSHDNNFGDFRYSISGNMSFFRTKILHQERARSSSSFENWRNNYNNRWSDIIWAHEKGGVIMTDQEADHMMLHYGTGQNAMTGPGDYYFNDLNGDGWMREGDDMAPNTIGDKPRFIYGFMTTMSFKGVDLSMSFNGAAKYSFRYEMNMCSPYFGRGSLDFWKDRWHQDENGEWIPGKYFRARDEWLYVPNTHDGRRVNARYLRLKSIELGYTLPKKISRKIGLASVRVFASGYNLFTFTNVDGVDPEYLGSESAPEPGGYIYPMARNYNFGITLTL